LREKVKRFKENHKKVSEQLKSAKVAHCQKKAH